METENVIKQLNKTYNTDLFIVLSNMQKEGKINSETVIEIGNRFKKMHGEKPTQKHNDKHM